MFRNSVLSSQSFRNLWLGQAISGLGDAFYYVSFMFMVQKLTGSIAMVGFVGAAEVIPFVLFSPYAGVIADRMDRRKIMLLSDLFAGGILLFLATMIWFQHKPPVWSLFVCAFALSSARSFFMPTKNATIPMLVPAKRLMEALSLSMATDNFMKLAGLSVTAGVLAALFTLSPKLFFLAATGINAISFLVSAYFIYRLPACVPDRQDEEKHPWRDFVEGLSYVKRRVDLSTLMVVQMLFCLMVSPFFVGYVAANQSWFGGKPQTIAWFEFAFFFGMIVGSYAVAKMKIRRPGLGFIYGLAVVGAAVAFMAFSRNFVLFFAWNVVCGLAVPFADIPVRAWMQLTVPDSYRGRVNSTSMMLATAVMPIGMVSAGALNDKFGTANLFLFMGGGMVVVTLLGLVMREFREAVMPETEAHSEPHDLPHVQPPLTPAEAHGELLAEAS